MRLFRGIWLLLRWAEVIVADWMPARVARRYVQWRLRGDMPQAKRNAMLDTLAAVERRRGDLRSSENAARAAIEICPQDWWSHVELAMTLEAAGRPAEARESLEIVLGMAEFDKRYEAHIKADIERLRRVSTSPQD